MFELVRVTAVRHVRDRDGIRGSFPPNRLPLVFEWRYLHREELRRNWERLRAGEPPVSIAPLE